MKILLLAPFDLFPPVHGGSSIVYNLIKHAAARHKVSALISHLYSLGRQVDPSCSSPPGRSFEAEGLSPRRPGTNGPLGRSLAADNVNVHYCRRSPFDRLRVLSFLVNPYYYRAAERICRQSQPDVIHCETLWPILAGWHLRRKYHVPLLWVEENIEALKFATLGRPRIITSLVAIVERFACQHADHIITLTEIDQGHLRELYHVQAERVTVITPSPDLSDFQWDKTARSATRKRYGLSQEDVLLTFVGNMKYEPNQHAVRRIADCIYPAVMDRYPSARFVVIGQGAEHLTDCRRDNIIFAGYVSRQDLVAHLSATDIFLVPVETGSGIRVKILEAAACGRAVVATRKATEGLEFFNDDEIVRVEAVDQRFVAAVLRLIEDGALRTAIGARVQLRTRRELGWDKTLAEYEQACAKAIAAARTQGRHEPA